MNYEQLREAIRTAYKPLSREESKRFVESVMKKVKMHKRKT